MLSACVERACGLIKPAGGAPSNADPLPLAAAKANATLAHKSFAVRLDSMKEAIWAWDAACRTRPSQFSRGTPKAMFSAIEPSAK